ncbi:MAG: hypothetical protein HC910_16535 [Spirulinaceae cyanobacterium SM2_1_0]|nr:hypothetical protein [Spirulinaceae cyanobacterium SM2_1_0]
MNFLPLAFGVVSTLGFSLAIAQPATAEAMPPLQLAQVPTACPPGFVPETPTPFEPRFGYNLECWDLTRSGIICVNNPNPECGADLPDSFSFNIPERRYDQGYRGFTCVNNPNPECGNPVRYGTLYGAEYESELLDRTASLWAEYEASHANRPTLPPLAAPLPASPPAFTPIPGLW